MIIFDLGRYISWVSKYNTEIAVNLFSGLLSAVIVLSLQTSVRIGSFIIYDFFLGRFKIRRLFGFSTSGSIIQVVSGSLQANVPMLMGPDAKASTGVQFTLESIFRKREVFHTFAGNGSFSQIPQTDFVTVGGPVYNPCTAAILAEFKNYLYFDSQDHLIIPVLNNKKYIGANSNETYGEDYGVILRVDNPTAPTHHAIVIAGCGSHAVYAGALLYINSARFPKLYHEFKKARGILDTFKNSNYLAIVKCKFRGGEILNVHIEHVVKLI